MAKSRTKSRSSSKDSGKKRNYASKVVLKVIESISSEKLKNTKNPKSTQKWLAKMKLSILRKISAASKTLFVDQHQDIQALSGDVEITRRALQEKAKHVRAMIESKRKESSGIDIPEYVQIEKDQSYEPKKFDEKAKEIGELFTEVAQQLSYVNKDLESRLATIDNSYEVAKPMLEIAIDAAKKTKLSVDDASSSSNAHSNSNHNNITNNTNNKEATGNSSSKKSAKGGSSSTKKSTRSSSIGSTSKNPALKLFNHLNKN